MRILSRDWTRLLNLWFGAGLLNAQFTVQAAFECRKSSLHFQVAFWRAVGFERPPCGYLL